MNPSPVASTFTERIKEELAALNVPEACCAVSQCAGMLLFAREFSAQGLVFASRSRAAAAQLVLLLRRCFQVAAQTQRVNAGSYTLEKVLIPLEACQAVFRALGYEPGQLSLRVLMSGFQCERCVPSFLRGAFLSCGAAAGPEQASRLELVTRRVGLAKDLAYLIENDIGFAPSLASRAGRQVLYLKNGERAEELLTRMGAGVSAMELMGGRILREVRNGANRALNCDSANTGKQVRAAVGQLEAIRVIRETKGLAWLPPELRELAELRLENPELSLTQLGHLTDPPVTKSGVNHRLSRLVEIAASVKPQ